ncbi:restriction endonuclease subunit S [Bifidobacterium bifidum]|uniref:restriction endonuclease subunit S n=1 Tax=Bifidobacterium bifidum TaxID=1681 RepID=UPI00319E14B5
MTEQAKVPAIRFAGFTDPWEQRKLGNCGTTYSGLSGKTKEDFGHGNARFVPYTNVFDNPLADTERLEAVEIDSSQNKVAYGDVFFTVSSETPDEVGMSSVWLSDQDDVYLNSFCFGYRQDSTFDPHYLAYMLRSSSIRSDLTLLAQGISRFNISKNKVMELSVAVPSAAEQKQIGQYFARLDSLITLHQRKYDKLVIFKKSMLEKMFPKDGESVPEIRFAGFTDPWEQRKLGELEKDATLYMGRGRVISAKDMSNTPGTFPVYSSSALDNGRMGAYGKYMFNQELITWSIDGGGAVFYRRKHRFSVTNVSGYIAVNPEKINCKFLAYAMSLAHSRIKFDYTVKAHPSVIRSLYTMGIPISLQEQQVIGSFFSRLDDLITLHQRKLELLQNIKKSLLDKMFA